MAKGKKGEAEDHIDAHEANLERLVAIAEGAAFESGTLVGDIRDTLMDIFKNRRVPWSQMSEIEQRDTAKAFETIAKVFIRKTVLIVAEEDLASVTGTLKGYSAKGGLFKCSVEANGDEETAQQLFNMDGHSVVIMSADHERFTGQKKDAEVQPDAPALPFADSEETEQPPADDSDLVEAADEDEDQGQGAESGSETVAPQQAEA
jgi:hypothetical protein